ncbi:MAG: hypothetical protein OXI25_05625 [Chloroflexota bacterium]|nr:hypothetical protein [Chloroflexota bacterium]
MAQHDDDDALDLPDEDDERPDFTRSRPWRWVLLGGSLLFLLALILPVALQACEAGSAPAPTPTPSSPLDFDLPAADGSNVRLSEAARDYDYVVVVFYRGFF